MAMLCPHILRYIVAFRHEVADGVRSSRRMSLMGGDLATQSTPGKLSVNSTQGVAVHCCIRTNAKKEGGHLPPSFASMQHVTYYPALAVR
jgi:hypothetical protein